MPCVNEVTPSTASIDFAQRERSKPVECDGSKAIKVAASSFFDLASRSSGTYDAKTTVIAAASEADGTSGALRPLSSLNSRQKKLHAALSERGVLVELRKDKVALHDVRAVGEVTGDEYSVYTLKGVRYVIRGRGETVTINKDVAADLISGKYGKWSGHTHPPGWTVKDSDDDRNNLPNGQLRSSIWASRSPGFSVFYKDAAAKMIKEVEDRVGKMRKLYGGKK